MTKTFRSEDAEALVDALTEKAELRWTEKGETMSKWISVKDRMPDLIPCNAGTGYSDAVIVWTSERKAMVAIWDGIDWIAPFGFWEAWGEEITHWMPLPELPEK